MLSSLLEKNTKKFNGNLSEIKSTNLRGQNASVTSLIWRLDNELWVKSKTEVVVPNSHLEILDLDQVHKDLGNGKV